MPLKFLTGLWIIANAGAAMASVAVSDAGREGDFVLVAGGRAAPIVVDEDDHRVVSIAATCLADDVERVTGQKPALVDAQPEGPALLVGSLDRSRAIRSLVESGKLNVDDLKGQWECFKFARVGNLLVIVGSDRRGSAYGALELSRAIGVSPWYWWADVPPKRRETIYISADAARVGPPSVKYRGIFLNDEDWGLHPWASRTFEPEVGDIGPRTYARIFELLLRLKANYCWPAMHDCTKAFNHYPQNKQVADDYAIVMGSSHAEPMLRNNVSEWPADQKEQWNPATNLPGILDYWETRVRENGKFENVYTVGMRGIHDSGMPGGGTIDEKRERLEKIIALQRDMLARHVDKHAERVPQIFCPYKETLDIYRSGISLPDDITIVWPDDNFGHIRQLPDERERTRGGRSGIYYHLSYWGRPHDYLWLESTSPALVWHEMTKAHELGADRLWVANVGDIKPIEAGMTFFLELAWKVDRYGPDVSRTFLRDFYREQFGEEHADAIADVKREYFRLCAIRKPEQLGWNTVYPNKPVGASEFPPEEATRFIEDWLTVARRTDAIAAELKPDQRPAYFQLVQYPAAAGAAMAEKLLAPSHARAAAAYERIQQLTRQYNEQLDGKWRHMMHAAPRKLPVFDPSSEKRVAATAAAMAPSVEVDLWNPIKRDARWVFVDGLGRRGGAMTIIPRLARGEPPVAEYAVRAPAGGNEFELRVEAIPTQPLTRAHKLECGVAFGSDPPQTVRFKQANEERDPVWQQNVLRNAMIASVQVRLQPGEHVLRLVGTDPSVAIQRIVLAVVTTAAPAAAAPATQATQQPATFTKSLPEGNHLVTVTFGRDDADSETTVKAESRRLMLERVPARAGESVTRQFTVNVRTPALPDGGKVKLNARESGSKTWDDQLTLEFLGHRAAVRSVDVVPAPADTITVYLAGDSTVTDQTNEPWAGWGQMLPRFFKPGVAVANHAESGRALRSFRNEKRLDKILATIKSGDYLLIQFGHNDMKEKGEGVGPFTTYRADLKAYVAKARERGATPAIVTSMHRRRFNSEGKIENTFGDYIEAARQAAKEENVELIDLNAMSKTLYEAWGPEQSKKAFVHYPANAFPDQDKPLKDDTHHSAYGAYELARCVVEAIRTGNLELKYMLADDVTPFDPSRPDPLEQWNLPASPLRKADTPEGR